MGEAGMGPETDSFAVGDAKKDRFRYFILVNTMGKIITFDHNKLLRNQSPMNKPIIEPMEFLKYVSENIFDELKDVRSALLCFDRGNFKMLKEIISGRSVRGLSCSSRLSGNNILICGNMGIGAPAAVDLLEQLVAAGIRRVISIGTAGALHDGLDTGDLVLCTGAFPDEGTSGHYFKEPGMTGPSSDLVHETAHFLDYKGIVFKNGKSWTTDAPFRETLEKLQHFTRLGADVVEMEASALYHVASYRNIDLISLFVIGDSIAGGTWKPAFNDPKVRNGLAETSLRLVEFLET